MRKLQLLGAALVAMFALGVVSASSASAATCVFVGENNGLFENNECVKEGGTKAWELIEFLLAEWLVGGAPLSAELLTESTGELLLEDTKVPLLGKAAVLCSGLLLGFVGANSLGQVTEVLTLNSEGVSITPLVGTAAGCTNQVNCEEPLLWAVNLGWGIEVELLEADGGPYFVVLFLPHTGGSNPGWELECMKSIVGAVTDECTGLAGAKLTLVGTTLEATFSEPFTELAGLKLGTCTQGGAESGIVEGGGPVTLGEGGELTASSETSVS